MIMKSNNSNTKTFPKKAINKASNKVVFKRVTIKEHKAYRIPVYDYLIP
jgi:hypothetical protein